MKNSFTCVILLTNILLAHVLCAPKTKTESQPKKNTKAEEKKPAQAPNNETKPEEDNPVEDDDNQEADLIGGSDDEDIDEGIQPPTLTCTLFDVHFPCETMCSMIGTIYGYPVAPGTCEEELYCQCSIDPKSTLDELWNTKFNAKSVLKEILNDNDLSKKVTKILQKPLRTREQTLQDLRSSLTPEQLKKIKVKDTIASKLLSADGTVDEKAIQKYVTRKLTPEHKKLQEVTYKAHLHDIMMDNDEDTKQYLISEIRRTSSKPLNNILDGFLKRCNVRESPFDDKAQHTLVDVLDRAIVTLAFSPIKNARKNPKSLVKKAPIRAKSSASAGKL